MTNCQRNKVIKGHGIMYLENRQELLNVNKTNKNDVIRTLGQPHSRSLKEKNTWIYIERTKAKGGIYGNASLDQLKELKEEGLETEIVPWVNEKDN